MADIKKINGMYVKDETARQSINELSNSKVDKEEGKSLVLDTEIERLATLSNYDDTELRELINSKGESSFSGSYNDLTDKPEIPSIEGLATEEFVNEKINEAQLNGGTNIDLSNYVTKEYVDKKIYTLNIDTTLIGYPLLQNIQSEIDYAYENNHHYVEFPANLSLEIIDEYDGVRPTLPSYQENGFRPKLIYLRSNTEYNFNKTEIKVKTNNYKGYDILALENTKNTIIKNAILTGDSQTHIFDEDHTHEWGKGIHFYGTKFCRAENCEMRYLTGDGVYMEYCISYYSENYIVDKQMILGAIDENGAMLETTNSYVTPDFFDLENYLDETDRTRKGLSLDNNLILYPGNPNGYGQMGQFKRKDVFIAFYNEAQTFISLVETLLINPTPIPSGARYFKFYVPNLDIADMNNQGMMIRIGEVGEQTFVDNCHIHHCRRQGVSISSHKNSGVRNCVIHDIRGTAPQSCIDIEDGGQMTEAIIIEGNIFKDSVYGVIMYDGNYHRMSNCYFKKCNIATTIHAGSGCIVENCTYVLGKASFSAVWSVFTYQPQQNVVRNCNFYNLKNLEIAGRIIADGLNVKNIEGLQINRGATVKNSIFRYEKALSDNDSQVIDNSYIENVIVENGSNDGTRFAYWKVSNSHFNRFETKEGQLKLDGTNKFENSKICRFSYNGSSKSEEIVNYFENCVLGTETSTSMWSVSSFPCPVKFYFNNGTINQFSSYVYNLFLTPPDGIIHIKNTTINTVLDTMHNNNADYKAKEIIYENCNIVNPDRETVRILAYPEEVYTCKVINCKLNNIDLDIEPILEEGTNIGYSYYNKTRGKFIYWNGTEWMDEHDITNLESEIASLKAAIVAMQEVLNELTSTPILVANIIENDTETE